MKHIIDRLKFDASCPAISRSAARAVVGSCNAFIIGMIALHLRNQRFGTAISDPNIDQHAEVTGQVDGMVRNAELREEQGHEAPAVPPLVLAGRMKLIRDALAEDLEIHAGMRELPLTNERIKDPFHLAQKFEDTFDWQLTSQPAVSDLLVKEEAKALNITEDEVREALSARPARQQEFLKQNREEIFAILHSLQASTHDGYALSLEQANQAFDALPALQKTQLMASADRALFRARNREIQAHVGGNPQAMGNIGIMDGMRREIRAEIAAWYKEPTFKRELDDALARGARYPQFMAAPAPVQPTEAQKALDKKVA